MRRDERWPRYGQTIKVEGGLRAQSTRGDIGTSWWSKRFLAVLEALAIGGRLGRGRNYARQGQVLSLEVTPGTVRARVQGSRPTPYEATITIKAFPEEIWDRVEDVIADQALFSARLLAGEMPPEIEMVFTAMTTPLFPTRSADLVMACTCPDWEVPCKHLAATFYLLAEAFDADPFQILHWRGRDRATLLANLRARRGDDSAGEATVGEAATAVGAAVALTDVPSPALGDTVDRYFSPPVPLSHRPPTLDTDVDLILRQLATPGAAAGGTAMVARLRELYRDLAGGAD